MPQFVDDFRDHLVDDFFWGQIKVGGENRSGINGTYAFSGFYLKRVNRFNFISKKTDAVAKIDIGKVDVDGIAFYPEAATLEIDLGAVVQGIDKRMQESLSADDLTLVDPHDPIFKFSGVAHTIDATYRSNDNDIPSSAQQFRGGL